VTTSTNTYDRLIALGAPRIAEPRFYRIKLTDAGLIRVELRERRKRFGSDLLAWHQFDPRHMAADRVAGYTAMTCVDIVARVGQAEPIHALLGDVRAAA